MATEPEVECYSGSRYAERPVSFEYKGENLTVAEVARSWRSPAGIHFDVLTSDGRRFRLVYQEAADCWSVQPG